jgi:hypothetical protein
MLESSLVMRRRHKNIIIVSCLSAMLFYYGAVWAMLRCLHDDHTESYTASVGTHTAVGILHDAHPSQHPQELECPRIKFHTESLASSSPSPQSERWGIAVRPHIQSACNPAVIGAYGVSGFSPTASIDTMALSGFPVRSPAYLSLSVLRL